jgi:hypothetical protein
VPFAARFGHTAEDLANDRALEDRLMDDYAQFHVFDDPSRMWCCRNRDVIRKLIDREVEELEAENRRVATS